MSKPLSTYVREFESMHGGRSPELRQFVNWVIQSNPSSELSGGGPSPLNARQAQVCQLVATLANVDPKAPALIPFCKQVWGLDSNERWATKLFNQIDVARLSKPDDFPPPGSVTAIVPVQARIEVYDRSATGPRTPVAELHLLLQPGTALADYNTHVVAEMKKRGYLFALVRNINGLTPWKNADGTPATTVTTGNVYTIDVGNVDKHNLHTKYTDAQKIGHARN